MNQEKSNNLQYRIIKAARKPSDYAHPNIYLKHMLKEFSEFFTTEDELRYTFINVYIPDARPQIETMNGWLRHIPCLFDYDHNMPGKLQKKLAEIFTFLASVTILGAPVNETVRISMNIFGRRLFFETFIKTSVEACKGFYFDESDTVLSLDVPDWYDPGLAQGFITNCGVNLNNFSMEHVTNERIVIDGGQWEKNVFALMQSDYFKMCKATVAQLLNSENATGFIQKCLSDLQSLVKDIGPGIEEMMLSFLKGSLIHHLIKDSKFTYLIPSGGFKPIEEKTDHYAILFVNCQKRLSRQKLEKLNVALNWVVEGLKNQDRLNSKDSPDSVKNHSRKATHSAAKAQSTNLPGQLKTPEHPAWQNFKEPYMNLRAEENIWLQTEQTIIRQVDHLSQSFFNKRRNINHCLPTKQKSVVAVENILIARRIIFSQIFFCKGQLHIVETFLGYEEEADMVYDNPYRIYSSNFRKYCHTLGIKPREFCIRGEGMLDEEDEWLRGYCDQNDFYYGFPVIP